MHGTTVGEKKCNNILKVIYAVSDLRLSTMNALDYGLLGCETVQFGRQKRYKGTCISV